MLVIMTCLFIGLVILKLNRYIPSQYVLKKKMLVVRQEQQNG